MQNTQSFNKRFAIKNHLRFTKDASGICLALIDNGKARAAVSLQGATLLHWQPKDCPDPVIWASAKAKLAMGKSVRGGVPICWPWFGPHAEQKDFPAHGYARTTPWTVVSSGVTSAGNTHLVLRLQETEQSLKQWPHNTPVEMDIQVGESLIMTLTTRNVSDHAVPLSEALHTYFHISDIEQIHLSGLEGCDYKDKVLNFAQSRQVGPVRFKGETDRVYLDSTQRCVINDPGLNRRIIIDKTGSRSTVVWNPWQQKADAMGDFTIAGWRQMVCVESANALDNTLSLAPGTSHELQVHYQVG